MPRFSPSLKLAISFLIFGVLWILVTDLVSAELAQGNWYLLQDLQHFKGLFFIVISTVLVYYLSKRLYAHIDKANRQQQEALKRYNVLGMATNDAIWDFNLKTNQCYTNLMLQEMFGYSENELSDNHSWWDNNLHPEDKSRVVEMMDAKLASGGTVWQDEYRFRCKDGSYKKVYDRGFIMRDSKGSPYRLIGSMQDVTSQRDLQSQFNEAQLHYKNELAQGVINAQELERKKLGEELHDNINQLLGVVKLYIEHAQTDPSLRDELLSKSSEYLMQVISEIRNMSKSLVPPSLKDLGLLDSLRELVNSVEATRKINIVLDSIYFKEEKLIDEMLLMIYRVIQEQLNNILKHAGATRVLIQLTMKENKVIVIVQDNGKGFDKSKVKYGMGLKNIRNRLDVFNGSMDIECSPGNGCKLEVGFAF